jgi:ketosteroid isomerase-like protein
MDPTDTRSPSAAIAAARHAFIAALRRADADAASEAYTDDARLLAPSAELLTGRVSIARFWQAGIDAGVDSIELHALDLEVEPGGETACEIGQYVLRLTSPSGDDVVDRGRYLLVYRREADGVWRRAAETFNPGDAPSRAEPAEVLLAEVLPAEPPLQEAAS